MYKSNLLSIVFLDIDGVLLPFGNCDRSSSPGDQFPSATIKALSLVLERVPSAKLVLSSTWRVQPHFIESILESLNKYGNEMGGGPMQGITFHDITNPAHHGERQHEIFEWLNENRDKKKRVVHAWVALDDEELLEGDANERFRDDFEGHVVKTESSVGLTTTDAEKAVEMLQKQLNQRSRNR